MKFKAYRDNIFCMTLRSGFGIINGLLCPEGEEEKGWGYTPLFGFFFFFFSVGVNYKL